MNAPTDHSDSTLKAPAPGTTAKGGNGMQLEPDANFSYTLYSFAITYGKAAPVLVAKAYSLNPDATKFPVPAGFSDRDGEPLVNGVEYLQPVGAWPPPASNADGAAVSLTVTNTPTNWGASNPVATAEKQGPSSVGWGGPSSGLVGLTFFYDKRSSGGIAAGVGLGGTPVGPFLAWGILAAKQPATGTYVVTVNQGSTPFGTRTAPTGGTWFTPQ